jgi:eukaryotic translation initiation factor 2C
MQFDCQRALDAFGEMWKAPPARLVMFRDGLSEGEWEGVGRLEIAAIERKSHMRTWGPASHLNIRRYQ